MGPAIERAGSRSHSIPNLPEPLHLSCRRGSFPVPGTALHYVAANLLAVNVGRGAYVGYRPDNGRLGERDGPGVHPLPHHGHADYVYEDGYPVGWHCPDVGVVTIYGGVVGGSAGAPGTPTIYVNNPLPTATITCSGCTTVVSTSGPPFGALKIHTWNVSAGNWVISGGIDLQANRTCDIDLISCADNNGGNHSFTVSDAQSAALPIVPTVIPNTTVNNITVIAWPGGTRADGGATWLAGTASSIYCSVRGVIR